MASRRRRTAALRRPPRAGPQRVAGARSSIWRRARAAAHPPRAAPAPDPLPDRREVARMPPRPAPRARVSRRASSRAHAAPPPPPAAPGAEPAPRASADQNLAEMAQRLEAALRRPAGTDEPPTRPSAHRPRRAGRAEPQPADEPSESSLPPRRCRADAAPEAARGAAPTPKPARAEPKPAPQKSLYDSLEQEMASLLGRPNSKALTASAIARRVRLATVAGGVAASSLTAASAGRRAGHQHQFRPGGGAASPSA